MPRRIHHAVSCACQKLWRQRWVVHSVIAGLTTAVVQLTVTISFGIDKIHSGSLASEELAAHVPHDACTDGIRDVTGVRLLMPFTFVMLSAFTKPSVNYLVFAPKTKELKHKFRDGLLRDAMSLFRFLLIGLMIVTLLKDAHLVWMVARDKTFGAWQTWNVILLAVAISPNIAAAWGALGMDQGYYLTRKWVQHHGQDTSKEELMVQSQGSVFIIYQQVLTTTYLPISCFLMAWAVPAMIVYFYISIPLGLMLIWGIQNWEAASLQRMGSVGLIEQELLHDLSFEEEIACLEALSVAELNHQSYLVERETFLQLGMPRRAVDDYLLFSIGFAPFILITMTLATRLYSGCGYWNSLLHTWNDRDVIGYIEAVWNHRIDTGTLVWTWI